MPSLRSRLFLFALRNSHLLRGQWKRRAEIDWNTSIPDLRQETGKSSGFFGKLPDDITVSSVTVEGVGADWIAPSGARRDRAILYFHGGGYVIGSAEAHRPIVAKFVSGSGIPALVFDYRLAPEHPFPAALEDAVTVYRWLVAEGIAPSNIVFIGDSAGGGLCLATLLALRDQGIPLPAAAVAMSPWTDLKNTGASLQTNAKLDPLTWSESWTVFSHYYVGENDPDQPWISPLYGDLHGLPPLLIYVGDDELLRDDSIRFADKAKAAGVDTTIHVGEGLFHCYPVCSPLFPEATAALNAICAFANAHVGSSAPKTESD